MSEEMELTPVEVFVRCYAIARGHYDGDGFLKHGTRQLYWKGRSDAATEIRAEMEKYVQSRTTSNKSGNT